MTIYVLSLKRQLANSFQKGAEHTKEIHDVAKNFADMSGKSNPFADLFGV